MRHVVGVLDAGQGQGLGRSIVTDWQQFNLPTVAENRQPRMIHTAHDTQCTGELRRCQDAATFIIPQRDIDLIDRFIVSLLPVHDAVILNPRSESLRVYRVQFGICQDAHFAVA